MSNDINLFQRDISRLIIEFPRQLEGSMEVAKESLHEAVMESYQERVTSRTGTLLDRVESDVQRTARERVVAMVKSRAPHAHLVEYGTATRPHPIYDHSGAMPELMPMRAAFDENDDAIVDEIEEKMMAKIERYWRG